MNEFKYATMKGHIYSDEPLQMDQIETFCKELTVTVNAEPDAIHKKLYQRIAASQLERGEYTRQFMYGMSMWSW